MTEKLPKPGYTTYPPKQQPPAFTGGWWVVKLFSYSRRPSPRGRTQHAQAHQAEGGGEGFWDSTADSDGATRQGERHGRASELQASQWWGNDACRRQHGTHTRCQGVEGQAEKVDRRSQWNWTCKRGDDGNHPHAVA